MDRNQKENLIADVNSRLQKAEATFIVDYQGLNVEEMNRLRNDLRKSNTEIQVAKNRLLKLASENTGTECIKDDFVGPNALVISYDDIVAPAKVLMDLSKDMNHLEVKTGQISGKPISTDEIKRLAELPSRDQLLSQVLSVMQAVPTSFVRVLNAVPTGLVNVLKAVEDKKNEE